MEKLVMEFDINEMSVTDVSELCDLLSKGDIAISLTRLCFLQHHYNNQANISYLLLSEIFHFLMYM